MSENYGKCMMCHGSGFIGQESNDGGIAKVECDRCGGTGMEGGADYHPDAEPDEIELYLLH